MLQFYRIYTLYASLKQKMARLAGFEPANDGTKTRCLTTWRQPNVLLLYHKIIQKAYFLPMKFS